jgi:hypothetical protein
LLSCKISPVKIYICLFGLSHQKTFLKKKKIKKSKFLTFWDAKKEVNVEIGIWLRAYKAIQPTSEGSVGIFIAE